MTAFTGGLQGNEAVISWPGQTGDPQAPTHARDRIVQALIWWGQHDVRLEEVETPRALPGEVLLRVLAAGICGSDVGRFSGGGSRQPPPLVLGHEFVGEVVESATRDGGPAIGDRVAVHSLLSDGTCSPCRHGLENLCRNRSLIGAHRPGAFAEYVAVPAVTCHQVPRDRVPELGALVEPFACALNALERGGLNPNDRLLILGAGALGLLVARAASFMKLRAIMVSDPSAGRRETAIRIGVDHAIDPEASDLSEQVADLSNREGIDVVIDTFGSGTTRQQAIDIVAPGGQVVLLGLHDDRFEASGTNLVLNEISVSGSFGYSRTSFVASTAKVGLGLLDSFVKECQVRPLSEGPEAFSELAAGVVAAPRVILRP